jgi:hypothetical protein
MAVSGVAVILQRFVVFHQHFTIFTVLSPAVTEALRVQANWTIALDQLTVYYRCARQRPEARGDPMEEMERLRQRRRLF